MVKSWNSPVKVLDFCFPISQFCMKPVLTCCLNLLSVSCLVVELFCSHNHDRYANSLFILIDKLGRGYHYFDTNACCESAASKNQKYRQSFKTVWICRARPGPALSADKTMTETMPPPPDGNPWNCI